MSRAIASLSTSKRKEEKDFRLLFHRSFDTTIFQPSVLDIIIGEKVSEGTEQTTTTLVSVSKLTEDHPKKVVVNAFIRRGATIRHHKNMPTRTGWTAITPLSFNPNVEK
ncbi:hypothetical protein [Bacillus sp. T2.9-1]|nr:hypothetical protein [Bacillus sp. T2.9-1]